MQTPLYQAARIPTRQREICTRQDSRLQGIRFIFAQKHGLNSSALKTSHCGGETPELGLGRKPERLRRLDRLQEVANLALGDRKEGEAWGCADIGTGET